MQKKLAVAVGISMLFLAGYVVRTTLVSPNLKGEIINSFSMGAQSSPMMGVPAESGDPRQVINNMMPEQQPEQSPIPGEMTPARNTEPTEGTPSNTPSTVPGGTPGMTTPPANTGGSACEDQWEYSRDEFTVTGSSNQEVLELASKRCRDNVIFPPRCPGPENICSQQGYIATDFDRSYEPVYLGITQQSGVPRWKVAGYCLYTRVCGATSPNSTLTPPPRPSTPATSRPKYCCSASVPSQCVTFTSFQPTCSGQISGNIFIGDSTCRNRCGEVQ